MTRTNPAKNDSPVALGHPLPEKVDEHEQDDSLHQERSDSPDQTLEGRIRSLSVPSTGRVRS